MNLSSYWDWYEIVIKEDKTERNEKETAVAHFEVYRPATHISPTTYDLGKWQNRLVTS